MADETATIAILLEEVQKFLKGAKSEEEAIERVLKATEKLNKTKFGPKTDRLKKLGDALRDTGSEAKKLAKEGDRLGKDFGRALQNLQRASDRLNFKPASASAQRLRAEVDRAGRAFLEFAKTAPRALNATEKELKDVEKAASRARAQFSKFQQGVKPSKFNRLADSFRSLNTAVAAFAGAVAIRRLEEIGAASVSAAQDLGRLENALNAIEGVNADEVLGRVAARADALGVDLFELEKLTSGFVNTALRMGLTLEEALAIIEGFSVASVGAGKSQEELARALRQVEQGISKGKFEMQDLKIIMEVIPGVTTALAKGFGITTEELSKLQKNGLIPAKEAVIVLAAELPKLFGEAVQKNAQDTRADTQRLTDSLRSLGRSIATDILPELEEWLELFKGIAQVGPSEQSGISRFIASISDQLQRLVRLITQVFRGDIKALFSEMQAFFLGFARIQSKAALVVLENINKITKGQLDFIKKAIEDTKANIAAFSADIDKIVKENTDKIKAGNRESVKSAEDALRDRQKLLDDEQAEREAKARKAREDFRKGLKDDTGELKKELKKRLDAFGQFFDAKRALEADDPGALAGPGIDPSGAQRGAQEIQDALKTVDELSFKAIISEDEIAKLREAKKLLQEIPPALRDVGAAAGAAGDEIATFTESASEKLQELAALLIGPGRQAFEELGETGRVNIGLIAEEFQRIVERGGVSSSEIQAFTTAIGNVFELAGVKVAGFGTSTQDALGTILNLADEIRGAATSIEATGNAIETIRDPITGAITGFSNLTEAENEAAEAASGAEEKARLLAEGLSNVKEKAEDAGEGIQLFRDEEGRIQITNADEVREAAEGLGMVGEEAAGAATGLSDVGTAAGEVAGAAPDAAEGIARVGESAASATGPAEGLAEPLGGLSDSVAEISETAPAAADGISQLGTALAENQESLGTAATGIDQISQALPALAENVALLAQGVPGLLDRLSTAIEDETLGTIATDIQLIAEQVAAAQEGFGAFSDGLDKLIETAGQSAEVDKLAQAIEKMLDEATLAAFEEFDDSLKSINDELTGLSKAGPEVTFGLEEIKTVLEEMGRFLEEFIPRLQKLAGDEGFGGIKTAIEDVNKELEDSVGSFQTYGDVGEAEVGRVVDKVQQLIEKLQEARAELDALAEQGDAALGGDGGGGATPAAGPRGPVQGR